MEPDLTLFEGAVDPAIRAEFPQLRLRWTRAPGRRARSPREVRDRLATLGDRIRGPQAIALRRTPVPAAHRVFFHHIGIDPDVRRVPIEEAVVRRLIDGGFRTRGLPADALTIGLVETGVAIWALDAATVAGPPAIRRDADGRLVVADGRGPLAELFGEPGDAHAVGRRTRELLLYAIQVPDVPDLCVEEAAWTCLEILATRE